MKPRSSSFCIRLSCSHENSRQQQIECIQLIWFQALIIKLVWERITRIHCLMLSVLSSKFFILRCWNLQMCRNMSKIRQINENLLRALHVQNKNYAKTKGHYFHKLGLTKQRQAIWSHILVYHTCGLSSNRDEMIAHLSLLSLCEDDTLWINKNLLATDA